MRNYHHHHGVESKRRTPGLLREEKYKSREKRTSLWTASRLYFNPFFLCLRLCFIHFTFLFFFSHFIFMGQASTYILIYIIAGFMRRKCPTNCLQLLMAEGYVQSTSRIEKPFHPIYESHDIYLYSRKVFFSSSEFRNVGHDGNSSSSGRYQSNINNSKKRKCEPVSPRGYFFDPNNMYTMEKQKKEGQL